MTVPICFIVVSLLVFVIFTVLGICGGFISNYNSATAGWSHKAFSCCTFIGIITGIIAGCIIGFVVCWILGPWCPTCPLEL